MKEQISYIEPKYLKTKPKYASAVTPLTKKEDDDLDDDVKTTKEIRVPLFISQYSNIILDGHNRQKKALKYTIHKVPCIIKYFDSLLEEYAFVLKINLLRRQMNEAQRILNSKGLLDIETKLAKQRRKDEGKKYGRGHKKTSDSKDANLGKASGKVAKIIGTSQSTYEKGQAIIKFGDKKIIDAWLSGKKKTVTAYSEIQFHKTLKKSPPLPKGIFNCIVIDLPIEYKNKKTGGSMSSGSKSKYPVISWEQAFRKIPSFKKLLAKDAMCFIWATTPHGKKYQEFLEKLGFKFKTKHYWIKTYKGDQMGMGYTFRGAVEELLVGYRGKAKPSRLQEHNYFILPATKHSEKPLEYYKLIERAIVKSVPKPKLIELYNRKPQTNLKFNWTFYGYDELEKKAILK